MIFFSSVFEFMFFLFMTNKYFKKNYPDQHNKFIVNASYNCIYYFSFVQIQMTKLAILLNDKYFDFVKLNKQIIEYIDVDYILDNATIYSNTYEKTTKMILEKSFEIPANFNFVILYNNNNNNKLISNAFPLTKNIIEYKETNYKFVLSEIEINGKIIKVDFKTNNYNFMVSNNIIDLKFIFYFMKKYYSIEYNFDSYKLKILDQSVNEIVLNETQKLALYLENYEIIN